MIEKSIRAYCSKINSELVNANIFYIYKNTTNLPKFLQIIKILVKVYFKYLNVKNESTLLAVKVTEQLNRKNF